jgi:hypothetical protein
LLAPGVPLPRSVWSNKIKIADDLGVPVPELEYLQAIRHDASWVVQLRGSEMNRAFFGSALADSTVRQRLTDLGQEIPPPEASGLFQTGCVLIRTRPAGSR